MTKKVKQLSSIFAPVTLGKIDPQNHDSRNKTNTYDWNKAKKYR